MQITQEVYGCGGTNPPYPATDELNLLQSHNRVMQLILVI